MIGLQIQRILLASGLDLLGKTDQRKSNIKIYNNNKTASNIPNIKGNFKDYVIKNR